MTYASNSPVVHLEAVDELPDPAAVVTHMDAAAEYDAVSVLRQWADDRLRPSGGHRVIDVGCGPGTAARRLAKLVAPDGLVVGVDTSQAMIEAARAGLPSTPPSTSGSPTPRRCRSRTAASTPIGRSGRTNGSPTRTEPSPRR